MQSAYLCLGNWAFEIAIYDCCMWARYILAMCSPCVALYPTTSPPVRPVQYLGLPHHLPGSPLPLATSPSLPTEPGWWSQDTCSNIANIKNVTVLPPFIVECYKVCLQFPSARWICWHASSSTTILCCLGGVQRLHLGSWRTPYQYGER